jgi:hypothetical protein
MRILCGTFLKLLMLRQKRIGMVARSPDVRRGGQIVHTLHIEYMPHSIALENMV